MYQWAYSTERVANSLQSRPDFQRQWVWSPRVCQLQSPSPRSEAFQSYRTWSVLVWIRSCRLLGECQPRFMDSTSPTRLPLAHNELIHPFTGFFFQSSRVSTHPLHQHCIVSQIIVKWNEIRLPLLYFEFLCRFQAIWTGFCILS